MSEAPKKVRLVRCPKCREVLPELPGLTIYKCGSCDTLLRAKENPMPSLLRDGVSKKSVDEMNGEGSGCAAANDIDYDARIKRSVEEKMADMMCKSKRTLRNEDVKEGLLSGSVGVRKSPTRSRDRRFGTDNGLRDHDGPGRSQTGPVDGSAGKMRGRPAHGVMEVSRSPARLLHGGSCESRDYDSNVKEKVGDWINSIGGDEEAAARLISPEASFTHWLGAEQSRNGFEFNRSAVRWRESSEEGLMELGSKFQRMQVCAWADQVGVGAQSRHGDKYGRPLEASDHDWFDHGLGNIYEVERSRGQFIRSFGTVEHCNDEGSRLGAFHGDSGVVCDYRRTSSYPDEGLSNYQRGYGKLRHSFQSSRGSAHVSNLELERAQLLQRYYEIKDQLSRTGDCIQEEQRISAPAHFSEPDDFIQEEPLGLQKGSPLLLSKKIPRRPPSASHEHRPVPMKYDDLYLPQFGISRPRPHSQLASTNHHTSPQSTGVYPYPYEFDHRQEHPSCLCSHCCVNNRQEHLPAPCTVFESRSQDILMDQVSPNDRDHRVSKFTTLDPSHANLSSEYDSGAGRFTHHHPRRILLSALNRRLYRPIAGGAPFVLCYNCFELLKLPRKIMGMEKNQCRLKCGACSARMELNQMCVPIPIESQPSSVDVNNDTIEMSSGHDLRNTDDNAPRVESYDCDANGFSFESTDSQPNLPPDGQRQNSNGSENRKLRLSPASSHSSRDESRRDTVLIHSYVDHSSEMPVKNDLVCPPPGAPLQEHFDYSFTLRKSAKNMNRVEQSKGVGESDAFHQRSVEASEMEVHSSEFTNNSLSEHSAEVSRDAHGGTSKGSQSSISAFTKGLTDMDGPNDSNENHDVYVNGQLIPPHELRWAEKQAGPISPGSYWYDSKAGFWGVMGHDCLGIIPPFIEEFSSRMPVDCAGGDTAIYVNGRQLHINDLELLASRGLPTTRDRFYVVEISGKVFDEDTGELVAKLGKLAPTVEKAKRGFGMRVPKMLED
ncbi:hypothetical protein Dimus_030792 [Dionaea muscipula]